MQAGSTGPSAPCRVPLVIRGRLIESDPRTFPVTGHTLVFETPDVAAHLGALRLPPSRMSDLGELRFSEVLDYLEALGERLRFDSNPHLQRAFEASRRASMLPDAVLQALYEGLHHVFRRASVQHRARTLLGEEFLDGWVDLATAPGSTKHARVRALGARTLHIVAGNAPVIGVATILNNAVVRGDAIIKSPANDPMTAAAVAQTMIDMAPDHPLTKHVSVAYWKGGDARIERVLYDPRCIEKIVAWGGTAAIRHVLRELPPGIDLITLDPKLGMAIIEAAALRHPATLDEVAARLALDIGAMSQEGCFNARLVYVIADRDDPDAGDRVLALGERTFRKMQEMPASVGGPPRVFDPELKAELDALRLVESDHRIFAGRGDAGAVIVSRQGRAVEFAHRLSGRVANIVLVETPEAALAPITSSTQTVSIYPASLASTLRDRLGYHGVQRIVALGGAMMDPDLATPQDGMELLRRMCRWVVEETQ